MNTSFSLQDQEEINDWYLIIKTICSTGDCYLLLHSLSIFASLIILSEQIPVPHACPTISGIHQCSSVSSYELLRQSLCYKHFTGCWEPPLGWLQSFLWGVRLTLLCLPFTKCVLLIASSLSRSIRSALFLHKDYWILLLWNMYYYRQMSL